jgi:hypothetical protein
VNLRRIERRDERSSGKRGKVSLDVLDELGYAAMLVIAA